MCMCVTCKMEHNPLLVHFLQVIKKAFQKKLPLMTHRKHHEFAVMASENG